MPVTGVNSYPSTAEEFGNHWDAYNAANPTAPLILPDGTTRAIFAVKVAAMNDAFSAVVPAASDERAASASLRLRRLALQPRFVQFGQAIRLYLSKSRFANAAPAAPGITEGEQTYKLAGQTVLARWTDINAALDLAPFVPPLELPNFGPPPSSPYISGDFNDEWSSLMEEFSTERLAGGGATQKRADRNALLPAIYDAMKNYRATCLLLLPKNSPLRATLPRLTPAPGTTPKALVVAGAWDNPILKARLTWPAAVGNDLQKLQVRGCTGPKYKADDEEIIADLPADATHYETDWALTAPGAIASFKVYVMTTTGNENGGKAVKIVRPVT